MPLLSSKMLKFHTIIIIVILGVILEIHNTNAECCGSYSTSCCINDRVSGYEKEKNCYKKDNLIKMCCGVGDCNILCCNCDGGCIQNKH